MGTTDSVAIGAPPWSEAGPDLAFLRLPVSILGDIERIATIVNGDRQRQIIACGDPDDTMKLCAMAGVIDEMTKPPIIERNSKDITAKRPSKHCSTSAICSLTTRTRTGSASSPS
jgi:hypothetical protein